MSSHILSNIVPTVDKTTPNSTAKNLASADNFDITSENEENENDFLTLILSKISTQTETTEEKSTNTILPFTQKSELLNAQIDDSTLLKEATFIQILQLLEKFGNSKEGNLVPKFNDKLKALLKNASIVKEFKGAKNIHDLLNLGKKYDLGLDKITITQKELAQLEKTFPKLAQKGFFQPTKRIIASETLVNRNNNQLPAPQKKEKPTTLSKILQAVEDKNLKKITQLANEVDIKKGKTKNSHPSSETTKLEAIKQKGAAITQETTLNMQSKIANSEPKVMQNELPNELTEETKTQIQSTENEKEQGSLGIKSDKTMLQKNVKNIDIKHTLNTFATDFKEKLEQYKPPIMKMELSLNPKELGQMDVTIVTRGSNLHVNFASNTQAMNLFIQNQMEFKNSLVNMGFTNLEMNFSDQRKHNENKNGSKDKNNHQELDEFAEHIEQENTILNMVIPNYV